jgi:hypothetical protein
MEQINILNWFAEKNPSVKVAFVRKLGVSIVVSLPTFNSLTLSDSFTKNDSEIRYEVYTMSKLIDHYTVQIFCYVDNNLVRFEDTPTKFEFV